MHNFKRFRLPVVCFALAFVVAASASAVAGVNRFKRVAFGTGVGQYGSGNMGCTTSEDANNQSLDAYCAIEDTDAITSYTSATAFFSNSNPTQPILACVSFTNRTGNVCSSTATNNCPNRGVCPAGLNIAAWQNNMSQFKYAVFENLTVGALLSGYQVNYVSSI